MERTLKHAAIGGKYMLKIVYYKFDENDQEMKEVLHQISHNSHGANCSDEERASLNHILSGNEFKEIHLYNTARYVEKAIEYQTKLMNNPALVSLADTRKQFLSGWKWVLRNLWKVYLTKNDCKFYRKDTESCSKGCSKEDVKPGGYCKFEDHQKDCNCFNT